MKRASELRLHCPAQPQYVAPIRHALTAFLEALQVDRAVRDDVTTAAGEALINVVEHAYVRSPSKIARDVQLLARYERGGPLWVDVLDRGSFIRRKALPGRGFGLRIMRAIAHQMRIDTTRGTCVSMTFESAAFLEKR
jgi:anti-sigma regulatory factor (Ser/Thr protein kinase)